jgi:hypothetical protein
MVDDMSCSMLFDPLDSLWTRGSGNDILDTKHLVKASVEYKIDIVSKCGDDMPWISVSR